MKIKIFLMVSVVPQGPSCLRHQDENRRVSGIKPLIIWQG